MSATIHDTSTWAKPLRKRWIVKYRDGRTQHSMLFDERGDAEQFEAGLNWPRSRSAVRALRRPAAGQPATVLPRSVSPPEIPAERTIETAEFGRFAIYMIRSLARRIGGSDIAQFGARGR